MSKNSNKPHAIPADPTSRRSRFGKIVIILMLLIVLSCCVGTLSICYVLSNKGLNVKDNTPSTTSNQNIVELICFPFADALGKIFTPLTVSR